jgi:hypothetical protein
MRPAGMPNSNQLFRLINEMVFMLVGALLLWVGLFGRYLFNPRSPGWLVLTAALVFWGLWEWFRAPGVATRGERAAMRIGGGSLVLAGVILLSLAEAPFRLAGFLLAAAGGVFVVRGLLTAAILARSS